MKKGYKAENELTNRLWEKGYAVVRVAGSGNRKYSQPDLLASSQKSVYGIECKRTSKDRVYIEKNEVIELEAFCDRFGFGCRALYAIRFNYKPWLFLPFERLEHAGKSYKVEKESIINKGITVEDLK